MKSSRPGKEYDPEKLKELAEKNLRPAGTGYHPGTVLTSEKDGAQYVVTPSGSIRKVQLLFGRMVPVRKLRKKDRRRLQKS